MNDVARAAAFLLQKMPAPTHEGSATHYYFSQMELARALENPSGPPRFLGARDNPKWGAGWTGPMDGGITYWAQQMMLELSEVGEYTELPEYRELQFFLEEVGFACDRGKMDMDEWLAITGAQLCPVELNNELATLLGQRVRPN